MLLFLHTPRQATGQLFQCEGHVYPQALPAGAETSAARRQAWLSLCQQGSVPSPRHRVSGVHHGGPEEEERSLLRSGLGGVPEGAGSYIPGTCRSGSGSRNSGYSGVLGLSDNKGSLSTKKILSLHLNTINHRDASR